MYKIYVNVHIVLLTRSLSLQKHTTGDPLPSWSPDDRDVDYPSGSSSSLHLSESTREEVSRTHFDIEEGGEGTGIPPPHPP